MTAMLFITKGAALGSVNRPRESLALLQGAEELARQNGWDDILAGVLTVTGRHGRRDRAATSVAGGQWKPPRSPDGRAGETGC